MNSQQLWWWKTKRKTFLYKRSNEFKNGAKKIKGSVWAIVLGFVVGFIFIGAFGVDPFVWFGYLFKSSFQTLFNADKTIMVYALYVLAGCSLAIVFRGGIFNIGVPGQMWLSSCITIFYAHTVAQNYSVAANNVVLIIIGILSGAVFASIAGFLKAYLNVNEVVSTIMLNWIAWYLMKFALIKGTGFSDGTATLPFGPSTHVSLFLGHISFIVPLVCAVIAVVFVYILLTKTTFGYSIRALGHNVDAAKYAGIPVKRNIIVGLAISGALAGLLGVFYIQYLGTYSVSTNILPTFGLQGIALSLVAFNNPIAILVVGWLWAIVNLGSIFNVGYFNVLPNELGDLVFGVIIYGAAIAAFFINFTPIRYLWARFILVLFGQANRSKYGKLYWELLRTPGKYVRALFGIKTSQSERLNASQKRYNLWDTQYQARIKSAKNNLDDISKKMSKYSSANEVPKLLKKQQNVALDSYNKLIQNYTDGEVYQKQRLAKEKHEIKLTWYDGFSQVNREASEALHQLKLTVENNIHEFRERISWIAKRDQQNSLKTEIFNESLNELTFITVHYNKQVRQLKKDFKEKSSDMTRESLKSKISAEHAKYLKVASKLVYTEQDKFKQKS